MRDSTIREAKNALPALVREAEKGTAVRLTRHGKPVAVLVSTEEYQRLRAQRMRSDPWEFLQRWRASRATDFEAIEDVEVDAWRAKSRDGGRKPSWGR